MITSIFLFFFWEERFNQKLTIRDWAHQITHQVLLINNRSSNDESRFIQTNQSIRFVCYHLRDRKRVQFDTCIDLCFENFYSQIFFLFFFFFYLVIYHKLACFAFFASIVNESWIVHDWSIWFRNIHFLTITSFDKRIFFFNSWKIIRIFHRSSSFLHQVNNFYEI